MSKKTLTGKVSSAGSIIYITPFDRTATAESIRFNSPVAYNLEVYKYTRSPERKSLVYKLELDAGDTVTDSFFYMLNPNEGFFVKSSTGETTYTLIVTENVNTNV